MMFFITPLTPGRAYSLRYIAVARPAGIATTNAIAEVSAVAVRRGRTPNFLSANSTVHSVPVKNSTAETWPKKMDDSSIREPSITMIAMKETDAAASKSRLTNFVARCLLRRFVKKFLLKNMFWDISFPSNVVLRSCSLRLSARRAPRLYLHVVVLRLSCSSGLGTVCKPPF